MTNWAKEGKVFSHRLKWQIGILKHQLVVGALTFQENALLNLTGAYDRIYHKTEKREVLIVEVEIKQQELVCRTYLDIEIFKNAPALKRLTI